MYSDYAYPSALSQSAIPRRRITNSGTISIRNGGNESCRSVAIHGVVVSVNPWEIYRKFYWRQSALIHCPPPPIPPPLCRVRPLVPSATVRSTVGSGYCRIGLRNSCCCCCCNGGGGELGADGRFDKMVRFLTEVREFGRPLSRKNSSLKYGSDSMEAETEDGASDEEDNRRRMGRGEVQDFSSNGNGRFAEDDGDFRERQSDPSSESGERSDMSSELWDLDGKEIQQPEKAKRFKREKHKHLLLDLASNGAKQEEKEQLIKEKNRRSRKETHGNSRSSWSPSKVVEKNNEVFRSSLSMIVEKNNEVSTSSSKMMEKDDDTSSLSLNLLKEEVKRQRSEINQLNLNYQKLLLQNAEEEHTDANTRILSISDMLCSRIDDRESSLSNSIGDLVEELRNQRLEIAHLIRRDRDRDVAKSSEIHKIDREEIESSNQVLISSSREREQQRSTVNQARKDDQRIAESSEEKESNVLEYSGQNKEEEISSSAVVNSKNDAKEGEIYSYMDHYRKHSGMLMESSDDNVKVSDFSNKMMVESSKEQACSTSTSNLFEKKKQESFARHSKTDNQMLTKSLISSQKERLSKSDKMKITSSEDREESSSSTSNLSKEKKQQNFACHSLVDIEKERSSRSNTMMITSSEGREERSTSSSSFVDEIRQEERKYGVKFSKSSDTQKESNLNVVSVSNLRYGEKISNSDVDIFNERTDQFRSNEHENMIQEERQQINMARASVLKGLIASKASASLEGVEKSDAILKVGKKEWGHQKTLESEISNSSLKYNEALEMEEHITSGGSGSGSIIYTDDQHMDEHGINDDLCRINHDVLESVIRLEQASSQYVGEFSNKLREEMQSASQHSSGTDGEIALISQQTSVVDPTVSIQIQLQNSSLDQPSASSEKRGPSDEIWDAEQSLESQDQIEELERESSDGAVELKMAPANSESIITKRSGRSLWTFATDLLKMNWTLQAGLHKSAPQSCTQRSSDESASSDVWFSGHERDEEEDKNAEKRGQCTSNDLDLNKPLTDQQISGIQVPDHETKMLGKKLQKAEGSHFLGSNKAETSSVLPSVIIGGSSHLPSTKMQNTGSKKSEWEDVSMEKVGVIDAGSVEGDVLRRRKFKRNKQILRENIEEWEELHKLESEQRNADEFFMREALLEAKLAAETWEVPIGAVLVQNSTIIARGRNLVEELRDSTAHAELICIREASNVLQNWRLSVIHSLLLYSACKK